MPLLVLLTRRRTGFHWLLSVLIAAEVVGHRHGIMAGGPQVLLLLQLGICPVLLLLFRAEGVVVVTWSPIRIPWASHPHIRLGSRRSSSGRTVFQRRRRLLPWRGPRYEWEEMACRLMLILVGLRLITLFLTSADPASFEGASASSGLERFEGLYLQCPTLRQGTGACTYLVFTCNDNRTVYIN